MSNPNESFLDRPNATETPRTNAAAVMAVSEQSPGPLFKECERLEIENSSLKKRLLLAEAAVTACHAAMLGKVHPKSPAWGCVYAVQDASRT